LWRGGSDAGGCRVSATALLGDQADPGSGQRDGAGIRRWVTCETRRDADAICDEKRRESRQGTQPVVDPDITIEDYSKRWLGIVKATVKQATYESYSNMMRLHVLPAFGSTVGLALGSGPAVYSVKLFRQPPVLKLISGGGSTSNPAAAATAIRAAARPPKRAPSARFCTGGA